jgi:hypothetical protein
MVLSLLAALAFACFTLFFKTEICAKESAGPVSSASSAGSEGGGVALGCALLGENPLICFAFNFQRSWHFSTS